MTKQQYKIFTAVRKYKGKVLEAKVGDYIKLQETVGADIERFFQLFARKKLLANETSVTFKASKAKKDFNDDQSSNRNRQNYENNFFHCQTSHVNGRPILHPSRRSSKK